MSNSITNDVLFRGPVLMYSLLVENLTSYLLARLIGIENPEDSRTLGNKSTALSFNQKVDFLIDLNALKSDDKKKIQAFMEIRNQLMHNAMAISYEKCFDFLPGKDVWLLRSYQQTSDVSNEMKLANAVKMLSEDVVKIITGIVKPIKEKEEKEKEAPALRRQLEAFKKANLEIEKIVDDIISKRIGDENGFDTRILKGVGTEVSKALKEKFESFWEEEMDKVMKESK